MSEHCIGGVSYQVHVCYRRIPNGYETTDVLHFPTRAKADTRARHLAKGEVSEGWKGWTVVWVQRVTVTTSAGVVRYVGKPE